MRVVTIKGVELDLVPGASLDGAMLRDLVLDGVDLSRSSLRGAIFNESWLVGANLSGSDLSGTNFYGADLRGADFSGCRLDGCYWNDATWSASTRWPNGVPPVPVNDPLSRPLLGDGCEEDDSGLPSFVLLDASDVVGAVQWPRSIAEGIPLNRRFTRSEQASVHFRLAFNMLVALHDLSGTWQAPLMAGFATRDRHLVADSESSDVELVNYMPNWTPYEREVNFGHCALMLAALGFRAVRLNDDGTIDATFEPVADMGAWLREGRFGLFELLARRALDQHFGAPMGAWSGPEFEMDDGYRDDDDDDEDGEAEEYEEDDEIEVDEDVETGELDDEDDEYDEDEEEDDDDFYPDTPAPEVWSRLFFSEFDPSWTVREMVDHLEGDDAVEASWRRVDGALAAVRRPIAADDPAQVLRDALGAYLRAASAWHTMDGLLSRFEYHEEDDDVDVAVDDDVADGDVQRQYLNDVIRLLGIVSAARSRSGVITARLRPPMNVRTAVSDAEEGDEVAVAIENPLDEGCVVLFPSLGLFEHVIGLSPFPAYGEVDLTAGNLPARSGSVDAAVDDPGGRPQTSWW